MKEMKFEKALKRLEDIVGQLEDGQLDLEKSLQLFEEGIQLARHCADKLKEAEQKIELLTEEHEALFQGEPRAEDEDEDEEEA